MENPVGDPYCIHGHWEDSICVCDNGYETIFVDLTLNPQYCSSINAVIVEKDPFYHSENLFHVMAMGVSFGIIVYVAYDSIDFLRDVV